MLKTDLQTLNTQQKKAVTTLDKNLLVLAPAGTGKTKVIALRTAYLIEKGIAPEQILCLTFTNKAAREMESRIQGYIKDKYQGVTIKTFHSFCYYIINCEKKLSHFSFPCTIIDEADMEEIVRHCALLVMSPDFACKVSIKPVVTLIENIKRFSLSFPLEKRYDYQTIIESYLKHEFQESQFLSLKDTKQYGFQIFSLYQTYLKENNLVDFIDLIVEAQYLLEQPEILKRWKGKYTYLHIDEMQDTSIREYHLIKLLGLGNYMSMFGDFNQTIYEWRGSRPTDITRDFKEQFQAEEILLNINYRSTRTLLEAANEYIHNTQLAPAKCTPTSDILGEKITILKGNNENHEFDLITESIRQNKPNGVSIAILTRTNGVAKKTSQYLNQKGIECIQVEDIKLFRRKEVKDILAYFVYAVNPRNGNALQKICFHPYIQMDKWILQDLNSTKDMYMYLHDWFNEYAIDSYAPLFRAYNNDEIIVLDVESTGLDTTKDDIIQIAAIRYGKSGVIDTLDILVKPHKKVGDSFYVHGFSDEQLEREGVESVEAFKTLLSFISNYVIVGHNINYDMQIINSSLTRYGFSPITHCCIYDTLDLAYKVYPKLENHKLNTLSNLINTTVSPTHNALNDILATAEVLTHLMEKIKAKAPIRLQKIESLYSYLEEYKQKIALIKNYAHSHPIAETIVYMMNDLNFKQYYTRDQIKSIGQVYKLSERLYDPSLSIQDNIIQLLEFSSLHYSELEQSILFKNKIPVITIHQSKGLEFDVVYICGCTHKSFPSARSEFEGKLTEELRLFYVAMTRAKNKLYVTYDNSKGESILIKSIGENYKIYRQISE